jgi:hypothetical protein
LVDPALGFTSGAFVAGETGTPRVRDLNIFDYVRNFDGTTTVRLLDYMSFIDNQGHTGGVNLAPLPCCVFDDIATNAAYIGDLPTTALLNLIGLSPGQVLTFSGEEWIVFPAKQAGAFDTTKLGVNPLNVPTSAFYGIAYRKA